VTTPLLDANALIALLVTDHEHHRAAAQWAASNQRFAVSPVVEGALVRFLVRSGESGATATAVLRALHQSPKCEFWPDAISYGDAGLDHVIGHRQVTDAYLVSLARARGERLATLDVALARTLPDDVLLLTT
jgi:uncharacterized protein